MNESTESVDLDEDQLAVFFESQFQEFGLEDTRMCTLYPIEYFDPETQKAWEIFKAGARTQLRI